MKVWRNSEGREFPTGTGGEYRWAHLERMLDIPPDAMRLLGYELVEDDSSVSATQVGAPSENDESVRLAEAQRRAWWDGFSAACQRIPTSERPIVNPYEPPSIAEPEEFEVVAYISATELGLGMNPWLSSPRLIPGKTYVVREKQ